MQSNRQQAYDRGSTIFSPDGRLYQVEYAREAVERGSATVGVRTDGSVVFATHSRPRSSLLDPDSIEKLHDLDGRLGTATAGHVADGRHLVDFARRYAQRDRLRYGESPGVEPVAKATADYVQESTHAGGTRPFGAALLLGGYEAGAPRLFEIDPSGTPTEWRATALGNGSDAIQGFLEDEYEPGIDTQTGLSLALRALDSDAEEEFSADTLDLAVLDDTGFEPFDEERCADAIAEAGLSAS